MSNFIESPKKFDALGVGISIVTMKVVIEYINVWKKDKIGRYVCVRDIPSLMLSTTDETIKSIYQNADISTPDGMPLVWLGRGLGKKIDRVCGPDLMHEICISRKGLKLKHFLYGGKPDVAKKLKEKLKAACPELQIVGTYSPPFRSLSVEEDREILEMIKESEADIVWVGISSPKQDIWMADNKKKITQTMIGVGAAFDFLSGEVPRAPLWMQKRGLEWLYRLTCEPKRLWRRYLLLAPKFLLLLLKKGDLFTMTKGALKG